MKKINPIDSPFAAGLAVLVLLLIVGGGVLTLSQLQKQQVGQGRASTVQWTVSQSASAVCIPAGTITISATFTNQESSKSINVVAKDNQTSISINMGAIGPGVTKTAQINTTKTSFASGQVTFTMTWTDGTSGSDTRTASYSSVPTCVHPTTTPEVSPTQSPTPKVTPTETPTPSQPSVSPTPGPSATPTPSICPTPGAVKNIKILCPYCSPTPGQ